MLKLSELSKTTMLLVHNPSIDDVEVMSKSDLLQSDVFMDVPAQNIKVSIAEKEVPLFDLEDILSNIGEDMYEDWLSDVYQGIRCTRECDDFLALVDKVFNMYPNYYPGASVEIDCGPEI